MHARTSRHRIVAVPIRRFRVSDINNSIEKGDDLRVCPQCQSRRAVITLQGEDGNIADDGDNPTDVLLVFPSKEAIQLNIPSLSRII